MFKQTLLCLIVLYILCMIYILFIHKSWDKTYAEQYYNLLKESQTPSYFTNYNIKDDVEFPDYMVEHFAETCALNTDGFGGCYFIAQCTTRTSSTGCVQCR